MAEERTARAARFERFSGWLTLVANLGVLVGLVLVILQLNQNERMIRAQTRHELSSGIVSLLMESATNERLASILYRGNAGEALSPEEAYTFELRVNAILRYWEDVHYQYRMGLYDDGEFAKQKLAWQASMTASARAAGYWCRVRNLYSPDFAEEMNRLIGPRACETARQ